ncbi:MAG: TolC family protein [Candidatus Acidiferrales bacterium]
MLVLLLGLCAGITAAQAAQAQTQQAVGSSPNSGGIPLTLQDAEAIALQKNPQITVGKLRALQAHEFVRETRSALFPTASLNLTGVGSRAGSRVAAGYLNNPVIYPRAAAGASVSQLITDFGRTNNLVSSSEFQAKAEDENAVATRQQIVLAVDEAFYNSVESQALLHVADETVKARQLLVDQVQALTNAKLKSDLDLSFSKVDLGRAQLLRLDSQNNYEASLSTLSAILGFSDRQNFTLVEPSSQSIPPSVDAAPLIQQALQQRPEVRGLRDEVTSATKFSKAEHDLWWPTISASGVAGMAPVRDPHIDNWYGAAGVNINIPIFNGFLFNARAKSADLETQAKQQHLQDLQNSIARDVRNAMLDTQKAYERLSLTQQLREQANLALELAQARYKLGLGSIVEFSQANLQKTEADLEDTDAHYQYLLTQIVLAYQMGITR